MTNAAYWRRHLRLPVRFAEGIRSLYAEGYTYFLEIGPHPVLSGMAQRIEGAEGRVFLPSLRKGWQDWQQVLESLAFLYVQGIAVDWTAFDKDYSRQRLSLPTYPWTRQRYWITEQNSPRQASTAPESEQAKVVETETFIHKLRLALEDEREEMAADFVHEQVARILRMDPERLDDNNRLMDIGVDSLMAVELRNRLSKGLSSEQNLPATLIFDHPTVTAIARFIVKNLVNGNKIKELDSDTASTLDLAAPHLAAKEKEIEKLSEQEAEARLLQKLMDLEED